MIELISICIIVIHLFWYINLSKKHGIPLFDFKGMYEVWVKEYGGYFRK